MPVWVQNGHTSIGTQLEDGRRVVEERYMVPPSTCVCNHEFRRRPGFYPESTLIPETPVRFVRVSGYKC